MSPRRTGIGAAATYRPHEIALAVALALFVQAISVLGLRAARPSRAPRTADRGAVDTVIPVRAVALEEARAPLLKRGGGAPKAGSKAARRLPRGHAPSRAEKAGTVASDTRPTAPAALPESIPPDPAETSHAEEADRRGETAAEDIGTRELPPGPGGEGLPEGSPEGTETDPLKARAIDLYRARLIAWFSSRFRVTGSGLPPAELERLRASATVTISSDRRVVSYTIAPSGSAPFDAAARAALEGTVGSSIPPPPASYPDVVQTSIHLTFVCRRNQCD